MTITSAGDRNLPASFQNDSLISHPVSDPVWLLFMQNQNWIPGWLEFVKLADDMYVPLIFQLLILEFAIDGLRLAAVNTPSMLTHR